jgi:2',3'-cyclic-nucleotide 2'-phosphodiesterase (5'-nucleotidase family)
MSTDLVIIHTNDTHGRLAGSQGGKPLPVAERLRTLLAEFPGAIYLDAGDTVSAGNLGVRLGGEPALEVLNDLGVAAMCLGNRETHPRKELFPRKVDRARFPLLSANMVAKGDAPLPVQPHVILERNGLRVGVFGVSVPMFTRKQWSQPLCDYWFDDPLQAAREQVAELRPQVDVLVALTHIGYRLDQELARENQELDLLIGGHSHTDLAEPTWVGSVPVLQARAHGFYAGIARMQVDADGARLVFWEKRPLRDDIPA